MGIIILCIIGCITICIVGQLKMKKEDSYGKTLAKATSNSNYLSKIVRDNHFSEKEIINSKEFQESLEQMKRFIKWMTLAGGEPPLPPIVTYDGNYIILEKKGYEVDPFWYREYVNGTVWKKRECALEKFFYALFKKYAEEVKSIVNIKYIADDLIEFEDIASFESDFTLKAKFLGHDLPEWGKDGRYILDLYRKELYRWIDSYLMSVREN